MHFCFKNRNVEIDKGAEIGSGVILDPGDGKIIIGKSYIQNQTKLHAAGGILKIGNNVTIGAYGFLNAGGNIVIEDNVLCADKVNIVAENHGYVDVTVPIRDQACTHDKIFIGAGSWLGINVTVLAGTRIGKNSVIGANSVVKGKFEDYCVIAGNPAKIIKKYDGEKWIKMD